MKVEIAPNGVNTNKFNLMDKDWVRKMFEKDYGYELGETNVVFTGRLSPEKGVDYLIESLNYNKNINLFITGSGENKPYLEELAKKFGDRVTFLGKVPYNDLPTILNAMDVYCLPCTGMEGFSNSMLEAMACGLPVITTPVGGGPEAVKNFVGEIVEPQDPEDIADAVDRVKNLSNKLIAKHTKENYSFEVIADKIYGMYNKVVSSPESICFASLYAPPFDLSGAGRQVLELSKHLSKYCHVSIICGAGGYKPEENPTNIEFIRVLAPDRPLYAMKGRKEIKKHDFDLVDGRNWEGGLIAAAANNSKIMSFRGEGAVHGWPLDMKAKLNKYLVKRVDLVTATDKNTAKMVGDLWV